jgi:hypothetical protein
VYVFNVILTLQYNYVSSMICHNEMSHVLATTSAISYLLTFKYLRWQCYHSSRLQWLERARTLHLYKWCTYEKIGFFSYISVQSQKDTILGSFVEMHQSSCTWWAILAFLLPIICQSVAIFWHSKYASNPIIVLCLSTRVIHHFTVHKLERR